MITQRYVDKANELLSHLGATLAPDGTVTFYDCDEFAFSTLHDRGGYILIGEVTRGWLARPEVLDASLLLEKGNTTVEIFVNPVVPLSIIVAKPTILEAVLEANVLLMEKVKG